MALLSTKSPVEKFLSHIEKNDTKLIYQPAVDKLRLRAKFRSQHFCFEMSNEKKKKLTEAGVELFPNSFIAHSHPFSKTVENHMLFDVLPEYIANEKFTFCSIKSRKVRHFIKSSKCNPEDVNFLNRIIDSKDLFRYPECSDVKINNGPSTSESGERLFPSTFINILKRGSRNIFFHDEVHHWSQKDMFNFLKKVGPKKMLFTVVFPPELIKGYAQSQNPNLYTFELHKGSRMVFAPDGCNSEAYEQRSDLSWLIKASHFVSGDQIWTVKKIKSIFAHHLFMVVPGSFETNSLDVYSDFDTVDLSILHRDRFRVYDNFPVKFEHVYRVYSYLACLKKPDVESGLAKLRQIMGESSDPKEFLFFESLCRRILDSKKGKMFGLSLIEKMKDFLIDSTHFSSALSRLMPGWAEKNLFDFMFSLGELKIKVEKKKIYEHILEKFDFLSEKFADEPMDPLHFFDTNENFNSHRVDSVSLERFKMPLNEYLIPTTVRSVYRSNIFDRALSRSEESREAIRRGIGPKEMPKIKYHDHNPTSGWCKYFLKLNRLHSFFFLRYSPCSLTSLIHMISKGGAHNLEVSTDELHKKLAFIIENYQHINDPTFDFELEDVIQKEDCLNEEDEINNEEFDRLINLLQLSNNTERIQLHEDELVSSLLSSLIEEEPEEGLMGSIFNEGEIDHSDDEDRERKSHGSERTLEGKKKTTDKNSDLDDSNTAQFLGKPEQSSFDLYKELFLCKKKEKEVCSLLHSEPIDMPGDGSCFVHGCKKLFDFKSDVQQLRFGFGNWLEEKGFDDMAKRAKASGVFFEAEMIFLFSLFSGTNVIIHDDDDSESIWDINSVDGRKSAFGHLLKIGQHFQVLPFSTTESSEHGFRDPKLSAENSRREGNDHPTDGHVIKKGSTIEGDGRKIEKCHGHSDCRLDLTEISVINKCESPEEGRKNIEKQHIAGATHSDLIIRNFGEAITSLIDQDALLQDMHNFSPRVFLGRKSYFVSKDISIDYGHNGVNYPVNRWLDWLDQIIIAADASEHGFNAALIQIYDKGASVKPHKDNEVVYATDHILTVNLFGDATFSLHYSPENIPIKKDYNLRNGDFFNITHEVQKRARHSVISLTHGRVSITLRKHVKNMAGTPIKFAQLGLISGRGNECLITALADSACAHPQKIFNALLKSDRAFWIDWHKSQSPASASECAKASKDLEATIELHTSEGVKIYSGGKKMKFKIKLEKGHFTKASISNLMQRTYVSENAKRGNISINQDVDDICRKEFGFTDLHHTSKKERMMKLINSFLNRSTGVCSSEIIDDGLKIFSKLLSFDETNEITTTISCFIGFAGSGKSRKVQEVIKKKKGAPFIIISPRTVLADDWVVKCEMGAKYRHKVKTFESALRTDFSKVEVVFIDELTLFPNGYLDLIVYKLFTEKSNARVVVMFDPLQARYHNRDDEGLLSPEHEVDEMMDNKIVNYLVCSFRLGPFFQRFFPDIACYGGHGKEGDIWQFPDAHSLMVLSSEKGEPCDVLLVDSQLEKSVFNKKIRCLTFGESQGKTFKHACIVLSESTAYSNEFRWMVALTRSTNRMSVLCTHENGIGEFIKRTEGKMINKILNGGKINFSSLEKMINARINRISKDVGGSDEVDREERLEGDPFLKPYIFLGQRINVEPLSTDDIRPTEIKEATHLFVTETGFAEAINSELIRSKDLRELRTDHDQSNQFTDNYNIQHPNSRETLVGPMRFKAIYPNHKSSDDVTFKMAVEKRLRFKEYEQNMQDYEQAGLIGGLIYHNFKNKLNLDFSCLPDLFDECVNEFEKKKLSKSKNVIGAHSSRSDIDWKINDVFLFMKSQLCTKYEKQFVDAKAGQTLACFQHLILVNFSPWCRYMEEIVRRQLPEEFYIHSNKNFDDLNEFVQKYFQNDICIESDYEAFDSSQDHYILSFETHLMHDIGIPEDIIDAYVELKCNLGCRLGHFAIMRFTGEFCTFFFNTLANIAFTLCRYDWQPGNPILFAGDDMCALNDLRVSDEFDLVFEKISLKAKVTRTDEPMFCGWRLTRYGIFKEPELVYNRFQIAIEEGKVDECLENYAIEVSYAYRLGERLFEVLKEEKQFQYHQSVVRFIVKHIEKLKTRVKDLFEEQSSEEDI